MSFLITFQFRFGELSVLRGMVQRHYNGMIQVEVGETAAVGLSLYCGLTK